MIRAPLPSRWIQTLCGSVTVNAVAKGRCVFWRSRPGPITCARNLHTTGFANCPGPLWLAIKTPPTRNGHSRDQGQLVKRSLGNYSHGMYFQAYQKTQAVCTHFTNFQAVNCFVSDAGSASTDHADPNAEKKFGVRRSKVGQLLKASPVVRVGQRRVRLKRTSDAAAFHQNKSIGGRNEFDYDNQEEIDIHSPEGALQESLPKDKKVYETLSSSHSHGEFPRISSNQNFSDLNEIDKQYFDKTPLHTKQSACLFQSEKEKGGETELEDERNEFDKQYFGALKDQANLELNSPLQGMKKKGVTLNRRKGTPVHVYMDTSYAEYDLDKQIYKGKMREALKEFDEKLGKLFEAASQDEEINIQSLFHFELHEKATEFKQLDDLKDHKELTFENEMSLQEKEIEHAVPDPLKAKLEAERIVAERKGELRVGNHNLSDLEPEIIQAMKSVWKAKHQHQVKAKLEKGHRIFGTADPSLPASDVPCSGCGALFQSHDPKNPGFMPSEKYRDLTEFGGLEKAVCQRCWYLTHHQMALNVSINADNYKDIISSIQRKNALVVVLVDLLDFPCSLIPNLKEMVGEKKPVVIVGNKADILPKDSADCNKRITKQLLQACVEAGVCNKDSVQHVCIISAKSGYGIEDLITALQQKWGTKGDVYLLGTANVGKSTLFNRLLHSDYCKAKAAWLINRATISRWPGTTLNLLRFPVVRPTAEKMALRAERLEEEKKRAKAEEARKKIEWKEDKVMDEDAYVTGSVGRSYEIKLKNVEEDRDLFASEDPFSQKVGKVVSSPHPINVLKKSRKEELPFPFKPQEFEFGKWFYDTPGVIHDQQILTKLTIEELNRVVPKKVIIPQTIILQPGSTFFLGGMGRLDYLEGHKAVFFTLFASRALPLKVTKTEAADEEYKAMLSGDRLKVPLGGLERMKTFPPLKPVEFTIVGETWQCSTADVLFSSAGWAAVTAGRGMEVRLRAYTPGGYGCIQRQPALLPYVVKLRGNRMTRKKNFYRQDKEKLMRYL